MTRFTIRALLDVDMEFVSVESALAWLNEHNVFDLLDAGAQQIQTLVIDPATQDVLGEDGGF